MRQAACCIVLLAAAVIPYFVKLGDASIWDANEAFYVETPREMIESGDYVNPSFNYEPRFNKPVLSYWIVAGLYQVFGVSVGVRARGDRRGGDGHDRRRRGSSRAPRRRTRWRRCWRRWAWRPDRASSCSAGASSSTWRSRR